MVEFREFVLADCPQSLCVVVAPAEAATAGEVAAVVSFIRIPKRVGAALGVVVVACFVAVALPGVANAAASVGLGTAGSFAVLAGAGVTNTGSSVINGNLGTCPTPAITGFPPGNVNGTTHANDAVACQAQSDTTIAYNSAAGRAPTTTYGGPTNLGGQTLVGGVYKSPTSFSITGTLTLDGQNDPDSVFIFQAGSTVITATNSSVALINGAQACNVFWQVGSSGTLGVGSRLQGTMIALHAITANTNAVVQGRLLARTDSVTLDTNRITRPTCAPPTPTTTTAGPTTTAAGPTTTAAGPTTTGAGPTTTTAAGPTTTAAGPTTTAAGPTTTSAGPTTTSAGPTTTAVSPTSTAAPRVTTTTAANTTTTATTAAPKAATPTMTTATTALLALPQNAAPLVHMSSGSGAGQDTFTPSIAPAPAAQVAGATPLAVGELPRTGAVSPWEPIVGLVLLGLGVALCSMARRPSVDA
jgi:type VI secretion system secreted protein VgrG